MTEREAALVLALTEGAGPTTSRRLRDVFGSYADAVRAVVKGIVAGEVLSAALAEEIRAVAADGDREQELEAAAARFIVEGDGDYPDVLSETVGAPIGLFVTGSRLSGLQPAVAVVGSRTATPRGAATARELASDLVRAGLAVVSGLARGTDTAAHEGALEAGGATVAVLGGGLGRVYPPENSELAGRIAERGAVVSEMAPTVEPKPGLFPRRNRIISGLSAGVVVVEAGSRSGALITAARALEQGREVFAVPGPVDEPLSRGPNGLIKAGAKLVEDAGDILDELESAWGPFEGPPLDDALEGPPRQGGKPTGGSETLPGGCETPPDRVLAQLSLTPLSVDDIVARTGVSVADVLAALLTLELAGRAERTPGGRYVLGARERTRAGRGRDRNDTRAR